MRVLPHLHQRKDSVHSANVNMMGFIIVTIIIIVVVVFSEVSDFFTRQHRNV
jgi:hypothetical protein